MKRYIIPETVKEPLKLIVIPVKVLGFTAVGYVLPTFPLLSLLVHPRISFFAQMIFGVIFFIFSLPSFYNRKMMNIQSILYYLYRPKKAFGGIRQIDLEEANKIVHERTKEII